MTNHKQKKTSVNPKNQKISQPQSEEVKEEVPEEQELTESQKWVSLYRSLDFVCIPVPNKKKSPIVKWREWTKTQPPDETYQEWDRRFWSKGEGIAIVCGAPSLLVVIDIDCGRRNPNEDDSVVTERQNIAKALIEQLPRTAVAQSGSGGYHLYYRVRSIPPIRTSKFPNFRGKLEVDIQANGKIVVAPPTIHPNGNNYIWVEPISNILELSEEELKEILDIFVQDKREQEKQARAQVREQKKISLNEQQISQLLSQAREIVLPHYTEGVRHSIAFGVSGILASNGIPIDEIKKFITSLCEATGDTEIKDRIRAVDDIARTLANGEKPAGFSYLRSQNALPENVLTDIGNLFPQRVDGSLRNGYSIEGFYIRPDGMVVKRRYNSRNELVEELVGPALFFKRELPAKEGGGRIVGYLCEHQDNEFIITDITSRGEVEIIKNTGKPIVNQKLFREYLSVEIKKAKKGNLISETGWDETNQVFFHPALSERYGYDFNPAHPLYGCRKKVGSLLASPDKFHLAVEYLRTILEDGRLLAEAIVGAFTSPLAELFSEPTGLFALTGRAGVGKTFASKLAVELFGGESLAVTSNITLNGLELHLAKHKDLPVLIDEGALRDEKVPVEKLIFLIASKCGKVRGTASLSSEVKKISSSVFFTTELNEVNELDRVGGERRIIRLGPCSDWSDFCTAYPIRLLSEMNFNSLGVLILDAALRHERFVRKRFGKDCVSMGAILELVRQEIKENAIQFFDGILSHHRLWCVMFGAWKLLDLFFGIKGLYDKAKVDIFTATEEDFYRIPTWYFEKIWAENLIGCVRFSHLLVSLRKRADEWISLYKKKTDIKTRVVEELIEMTNTPQRMFQSRECFEDKFKFDSQQLGTPWWGVVCCRPDEDDFSLDKPEMLIKLTNDGFKELCRRTGFHPKDIKEMIVREGLGTGKGSHERIRRPKTETSQTVWVYNIKITQRHLDSLENLDDL